MNFKLTNANNRTDSAKSSQGTGTRINNSSWFRAARAVALFGVLISGTASAEELFHGYNNFGVLNGPRNSTFFTVTGFGWNVNQIATYHYNNGRGTTSVGNIKIFFASNGALQGTYRAVGIASGNVPNANWIANTNQLLLPGTYRVSDDSVSTWSFNNQSGGAGFVNIFGTRQTQPVNTGGANPAVPGRPVAPTPTPIPTVGMNHPDLRPWGGDGPVGTTPSLFVNLPTPSNVKFIEQLAPYTSAANEAARCGQMNGTFKVIRDQPWYYTIAGFYAIVACVQ
jgi:hypothetical protein